ncbi:hypothetical protein [Kutzneria albida]|uniref:DUF885 domain-containing protein n=1 Tax=Kutzneria albida DSM 43870 TaxID=1449976 RepID=W5VZB0_9PSEU|nr:hypothetical protein [Kutzneria albida]AHH94253.1 hypothetical protein KALB_879 [Kutzneria albida DSM 43870]
MDADRLVLEYLLLGLRLGRLRSGLVDAYTGPARHQRQVEAEPVPDPADLARAAEDLRKALADTELPAERRTFLDAQLVALACNCRVLSGEPIGFVAQVESYSQTTIGLGEHEAYRQAHDELRALLPGWGTLRRRVNAHRTHEQVPLRSLEPAVHALSAALRARVHEQYGLPAGESVEYEVVSNRPWSGFNSYLGEFRSQIAVNADLGHRLSSLPQLVAHEAYPGHHTEHCVQEAGLVRAGGRLEHTISLLNTPRCLVSEGLAELGLYGAVGPSWGGWVAEVLAEVGLTLDGPLAEAVERASAPLDVVRQDAALLLHDRGADPEDVLDHLKRWLLLSDYRANQVLRFVADPLWRAHITTYVEGRRLLRSWLDARPAGEPVAVRFARLLRDSLVPASIRVT